MPETTSSELVGSNQILKGPNIVKLQDLFNQTYRDTLILVPGKTNFNKTFLCIIFVQKWLHDPIPISLKFI